MHGPPIKKLPLMDPAKVAARQNATRPGRYRPPIKKRIRP